MLLQQLSNFNLLDLIVLVLATYRMSIMLASDWEAGPAGLLAKLREQAGLLHTEADDPIALPGSLAEGLMCTHCNSVWIGTTFTVLYALLELAGLPASLLFLPLALSGASVLLVRAAGAGQ